MADNQQQPPDEPRDAADRPPAGAEADRTREMPAAGDETEVMPPVPPSDDTTRVSPGVPSWSGRAGVPPPPTVVHDALPTDEELQAERRWWMPVVAGLVALAVLALLGFGLWLALREPDDADPVAPPVTPAVTPTATPTPPSPSPAGTPSAVPTTATPSGPEPVVLPRLVGLDSGTAGSILDSLGLPYRVTSRLDPTARPGTVLETDPAEGSLVREDTPVTVVIASAPSPAPPSPVLPSAVLPSPTPSR